MKIGTRDIQFGSEHPCHSIVEIGVNHNGDMDIAKTMVREIARAGGDIVKFQAFIAEEEISVHAEKASYQKETTGADGGQLEMAKALELSHQQLTDARDFCAQEDMPFLCTAFDPKSLAFLIQDLQVEALKIASSEVTAHPFLADIAASGAGLILSTGASTLEEVASAVRVIEQARPNPDLVILHCVSEYPAPEEQVNLRAMHTMAQAFGYPVGYSDHTQGIQAPIVASALGACAIEKHFTLDRNMEGPDHKASIEPDELREMCAGLASARAMLGTGVKLPVACEEPQIKLIRKAIVARHALTAGHVLTPEDLALKRPENGIAPAHWDTVIGRTIKADLERDAPLQWDVL